MPTLVISAAAPRTARSRRPSVLTQLDQKVFETRVALPESTPEGMQRALTFAHAAARQLIKAADKHDVVEVQISISDTPLGGWQATVCVDVPVPTQAER